MPKALFLSCLFLAGTALAAPVAPTDPVLFRDGRVREGQWDRARQSRPLLNWETLRGYRLFFHPHDTEKQRRWLGIGLSKRDGDMTGAWALVRPFAAKDPRETWLRVEGVYSGLDDYASLEWDGLYRGREFPDLRYRFDVQARFGKEKKEWKVVAVKSLDHPRFYKVAGRAVGDNPLRWNASKGEYLPAQPAVALSASQTRGKIPVLARVYLPDMEEDFRMDGVLIQARKIDGGGDLTPIAAEQWQCACAQFIGADSPARKKLRTVRCWWELPADPAAAQGVWELRAGLFHQLKHPALAGPCDLPILDEDRVWVRVGP